MAWRHSAAGYNRDSMCPSSDDYPVHPLTGPDDTDEDAAAMQRDLFRRAGPAGRLRAAASLSDAIANLARAAVRREMPDASDDDVNLAFLARCHGPELADTVRAHLASRRKAR